MSSKLSFKFSFKITSPYKIDLPPEVAKACADGFTLMEAWRRYRGFTRKEVAARAGVPDSTYGNQERGFHKPIERTLEKIAAVLEISIDQLVE